MISVSAKGAGGAPETVEIPAEVAEHLATLKHWVEDVPETTGEAVPVPVNVATLNWVLAVAAAVTLPPIWTDTNRIDLCSGNFPEAVSTLLDGVDRSGLSSLAKDLDFLGGGPYYDYVCRYVAMKISDKRWSIDEIQDWFGVPEELPITE